MAEIRIPKRFFLDHWERDLPTPEILRDTAKHYFISSDDPNLPELLDDAAHYAHAHGPDEAPAGLKPAARALIEAVRQQAPETAPAAGGRLAPP